MAALSTSAASSTYYFAALITLLLVQMGSTIYNLTYLAISRSYATYYVGFSRCGDPDCVFVFADQKEFEGMQHLLPKDMIVTRNIVYKEIFQRSCILR